MSLGITFHQREATPNPRLQRIPRPYSKLAFTATTTLDRQTASLWTVKKKPEQHKIDGVGFKSIKINETLSQHSQRTGQLENMPKLKAKQQHF